MNPTFAAADALLKWVNASRAGDPNATNYWNEYLQANQQANLQKASRRENEDGLQRVLDQVVEEELRWLNTTMRHREPTKSQWMAFVDRVTDRVSDAVKRVFDQQAMQVYLDGMDEVAREAGAPIRFGGQHKLTLDAIRRGDGMADTFASFGRGMANRLKRLVVESFEAGRSDSSVITQLLIRDIGWQARSRLSTIARTETFKIWETARMKAYEELERERGMKFKYRFGTVNDPRTCHMCNAIMDSIPDDGLELEDLKHLIVQISTTPPTGNPRWDPERDGNFPLPHPNCRHRVFRVVSLTPEGSQALPQNITPFHRMFGKAWIPYDGPKGGKGWRNTLTGRIIYGASQPGERSKDVPEQAPMFAPDYDRLHIEVPGHYKKTLGDLYQHYVHMFQHHGPEANPTYSAIFQYRQGLAAIKHKERLDELASKRKEVTESDLSIGRVQYDWKLVENLFKRAPELKTVTDSFSTKLEEALTDAGLRVENARWKYVPDLDENLPPSFEFDTAFEDAAGSHYAGGMTRKIFWSAPQDCYIVDRYLFQLRGPYQGKSIGKALEKAHLHLYQELANKTGKKVVVEMQANIDIGGYAWATYGYEPAGEHDRGYLASKLRDRLSLLKLTNELPDEIVSMTYDMLDRFQKGEVPIREVAAWDPAKRYDYKVDVRSSGEYRPFSGHLGKVLLLGMSWDAKMIVEPHHGGKE